MDTSITAILTSIGGHLIDYGFNLLTAPRHDPTEARIQHLDQIIQSIPDGELIPGNPSVPLTKSEESKQESEHLTTEETVKHQKREIVKELLLLEGHLQQSCKIGGKACDCCTKHPITIEGLAEETAGMTPDPVFRELAEWVRSIGDITTEAASASGQYDEQYPGLAIKARGFRKAIMPTEKEE